MSSSSGGKETLTSPTEQQANALEATTMYTKLMVAIASGDVQQLKDLMKQQESQTMVAVMANRSAPAAKPHQGNMDPHLLALASSGSSEKLRTLLNMEDGQASSNGGTDRRFPIRRAFDDDIEANESILAGVTAEGDTALHVVAACGQAQGDSLFTSFREVKHLLLAQQKYSSDNSSSSTTTSSSSSSSNNNKRQPWLTHAARQALTTYGDGDKFLESACTIYGKVKHLLFMQNNNDDTPLHCAARAGKSNMVKCLIRLALDEGEGRVKELLRKENKHKETALHEAVRVGNKDIVDLLMEEDSGLANFPQDSGVSPMYLAIMLKQDLIEATLYEKSHGKLSFSGPNGQNALHAAVLRYRLRHRHQGTGLSKLLEWNATHLCPQNKDLTTQRDENGSTPLHFAAAIKHLFGPSRVCRQVLEANPDALYQPDHDGVFPIHVAASVGASSNFEMFVKMCPGSAGLRDAKGRTFLHIAVEKKEVGVIWSACRNLSLLWIMNMVDTDGNTALHLAAKTGSLRMFCPLLGNPQVNLNLTNNRGETPLDIAEYKIPEGIFYYDQNSEAQIRSTLRIAGAVKGVRRQDNLQDDDDKTVRAKHDKSKEMEALKDSTQTLCIGSGLIVTVTFGATLAVPGGYIAADDHHGNGGGGGTPVLAGRYAFDAFMASNALAFIFSGMATISLMHSGSPALNPQSRAIHLRTAFYLLSISLTSLAAAFALGAYAVLAPVSHKTAVATCVLTCIALLYKQVEFLWRRLLLLAPLRTRKGLIWTFAYSALVITVNMLLEHWPLIFIFGWAVHANPPAPKIL